MLLTWNSAGGRRFTPLGPPDGQTQRGRQVSKTDRRNYLTGMQETLPMASRNALHLAIAPPCRRTQVQRRLDRVQPIAGKISPTNNAILCCVAKEPDHPESEHRHSARSGDGQ